MLQSLTQRLKRYNAMLPVQTDTLESTHIEDEPLANYATKTLVPIGSPSTHMQSLSSLSNFRRQPLTACEHRPPCSTYRLDSERRLLSAVEVSRGFDVTNIAAQIIKRPFIHQISLAVLCPELLASRLEIESPSQSLLVSFCTQPLDITRYRALAHSSSCQCQSEW